MGSDRQKKFIYLLSLFFTVIFLIFAVAFTLSSIQKIYTYQVSTDELVRYEILLAMFSIFAGGAIAFLLSKVSRGSKKGRDILSQTLQENDDLRRQFHCVSSFFHLCLIEIDPNSNVVYANKLAGTLFGTDDDLTGRPLGSLIADDCISDEDIAHIFNNGKDCVTFTLKKGSNGTKKVFQGVLNPIMDSGGEICKAQILLRDITDITRKNEKLCELEDDITRVKSESMSKLDGSLKASAKLRNSIKILTDIFICAPTGLIVLNKDGNITNFNRAAENLFDYHEKDVIGNNIDTLHSFKNFKEEFLSGSEYGNNVEGEVDCLRSDMSHFVGIMRVKPVFNDKHNVIRYVVSINDVTKRTVFEKFILLKNQELLSINEIFMSTNQYNELDKKLSVFLDRLFDNLEVVRKGLIYFKNDKDTLELYMYKGLHYTVLKKLQQINIKKTLC